MREIKLTEYEIQMFNGLNNSGFAVPFYHYLEKVKALLCDLRNMDNKSDKSREAHLKAAEAIETYIQKHLKSSPNIVEENKNINEYN